MPDSGTLPPPPVGRGTEEAVQTRRLWVLAAIVLVIGFIIYFAVSIGGSPFSARATGAGISAGGRWQVTVSIRNTGSESATPSCTITFIDGDGAVLASDSFEGNEMPAGDSDVINVLTGFEPGENIPTDVRVECD